MKKNESKPFTLSSQKFYTKFSIIICTLSFPFHIFLSSVKIGERISPLWGHPENIFEKFQSKHFKLGSSTKESERWLASFPIVFTSFTVRSLMRNIGLRLAIPKGRNRSIISKESRETCSGESIHSTLMVFFGRFSRSYFSSNFSLMRARKSSNFRASIVNHAA
jgi:hypothetical protein